MNEAQPLIMMIVDSIPPDHETATRGADAGEERRQRADYHAAFAGRFEMCPTNVLCLLTVVRICDLSCTSTDAVPVRDHEPSNFAC